MALGFVLAACDYQRVYVDEPTLSALASVDVVAPPLGREGLLFKGYVDAALRTRDGLSGAVAVPNGALRYRLTADLVFSGESTRRSPLDQSDNLRLDGNFRLALPDDSVTAFSFRQFQTIRGEGNSFQRYTARADARRQALYALAQDVATYLRLHLSARTQTQNLP